METFTPENSPGVMEWLRAIEYLRDNEGLFPELKREEDDTLLFLTDY